MTNAARSDVPMGGLYSVQRQLEALDYMMVQPPNTTAHIYYRRTETHRTMILGILARLDAAICDIKES